MPKRGGWTFVGEGGGKSRGRGMGRRLVNAAVNEMSDEEELAKGRREKLLKAVARVRNKENTAPPIVKTVKKIETPLQPTNSNNNSSARPVPAEIKKVAATSFLDNNSNNKSNDELAFMALTETKKTDEAQLFPVFDSNEAFPSAAQGKIPVTETEQVALKDSNVECMLPMDSNDNENNHAVSGDKKEKEPENAGNLKRHSETTAEGLATTLTYGPSKKKYPKKDPLTPEQASEIRKGQLLSFARWWRSTTEITGGATLDDTISHTPMAVVLNEAAGPNYLVGAFWCTGGTMVETSELPYAWMEIDVSMGTVVREGGSSPLAKDHGGFLDSLKVQILSTMNCDDIPVVASMADWKNSIATSGEGEPAHTPVFLAHVPDWIYAVAGSDEGKN